MAEEIEERTADADSLAADGRPEDTEQRERVVKNTGLMTVGTLASRATGLLRTWAMAYALGNTLLTSSYQVANNLPNVLYELVAGGFLSAAFLPVLLLQKERFGREGENRYTSNILNITLIALGALSILSCIFADAVVSTQTFTVGDTAEVHQRTVEFFRVFAFQIVFYGLGGVLTGVLNAHRSFFLTSIAPALNNLVTIAGFVAFAIIPQQEAGIVVLAVATTAGVAVQFVIQIPALVKSGFRWQPYVKLRDPAIRETMKIALPSVIYIAANLVAYTFRNAFSLNATETGPSALAYAWMWFQLPYGVVAVSLSSTMFTEMSDDVAKGDMGAFRKHVYRGLSGTLFLIIPLTGLLCVLSEPIFQLFHAGAFNGADVTQVASLLAVWVLCLPIYSVGMYLYKAFASLRKMMTFALLNCAIVVVQLVLYAILCRPDAFGIYGVPIADFVYYTLRGVASILLLRHYAGKGDAAPVWRTALLMLLSTLVGMGLDWVLLNVGHATLAPLEGMLGHIALAVIELLVCATVGLAAIFGLAKVLKVDELKLLSRLANRFRRRK